MIELPHTAGCLACGRENPHGLRLSLHVAAASGVVTALFTPRREHIGFEGLVHGGLLATIVDEAMVWAATWRGRRFCVCGEMTARFRQSAAVGRPLRIVARVESARPRLVSTSAEVRGDNDVLILSGSGKYVPVSPERNQEVLRTLVAEPSTAAAAHVLMDTA